MSQYNTNGWVFRPDEIDHVLSGLQNGEFADAAGVLKGTGEGKTVLLHTSYKKIGMEYPVLNQGTYPTCASFTGAGGADLLKVVEIANGEREEFKGLTASEIIYAGARKLSQWRIRGGGASVAMVAKYLSEFGVIIRGKYGNIDLSKYDGEKATRWGNNSGYPSTLETISKEHCIKSYARVNSWEEYRDSIANQCPILLGSSFGFENTTDDQGFAKTSGEWNHAMLHIAIRHDRPGGLIMNSWGTSWNKIRKINLEQPLGSFWVDASTIDRMCKNGDCWSISKFDGFKKQVDASVSW